MAGDSRDHVLRPSDLIVLDGRGLAALHAIGEASVHCSVTDIDLIMDWQDCARSMEIGAAGESERASVVQSVIDAGPCSALSRRAWSAWL